MSEAKKCDQCGHYWDGAWAVQLSVSNRTFGEPADADLCSWECAAQHTERLAARSRQRKAESAAISARIEAARVKGEL